MSTVEPSSSTELTPTNDADVPDQAHFPDHQNFISVNNIIYGSTLYPLPQAVTAALNDPMSFEPSSYTQAAKYSYWWKDRRLRWAASCDGWFKLNVDEAAKVDNRVGGAGGGGCGGRCGWCVVIRTGDGRFVAAGFWRFQGCSSVKHVELATIREGLRLARRVGCGSIQVETDSMEAISTCKGDAIDYPSLRFIVSDIEELASEFSGCTFSYVPCTYNGAAHRLIKLSLIHSDSVVWFEEPPDGIRGDLDHDMYSH
ncbi:hypothetical protein D8674_033810 [Pyrus ussuriensis x Pyrus communis]|uniref:RNase H type-1 domain-containing protein n=1 Tax=Pyrus ussuriensis x Pyrus communis TaxID=2448454 RepID=A0A5N5HMF8_9ROSA|nr:hypothetical protein D8674_033810 [Pyrus ussuriensis x Pyrus communis]